jgi:hypothetical protein
MSPVVGLLIAVIAGWLASRPRAVVALVVPPMLGATAAQSWFLGTGRGDNPPSTTTKSPGYWLVQALIIVAICGVAAAVCWMWQRWSTVERVEMSGWPRVAFLAAETVAAFAVTLGAMFIIERPSHPGSGSGQIPITGAIAVVVGLVVIAAVVVNWLHRSRQLEPTPTELAR